MNEKREVVEEITEGLSLLDVINTIRANMFLLIAITILFLAGGLLYTFVAVTPMYTSSVSMQIHIEKGETTGTDAVKTVAVTQVANNIMEYIKFPDVIKPIITEYFSISDPREVNSMTKIIAGRISTAQIGNASAVRISYEHSNPEMAAEIVVALAEELAERINRPSTEEGSLKFSTETVKIINKPLVDPNQKPSSPNKILNICLSLILGLVTGVIIIIIKEQFKNYYSSKKDVEQTLHLPVLTIIDSGNRR